MSESREWWIFEADANDDEDCGYVFTDVEGVNPAYLHELIHVIEYSTYEQLKAENERLKFAEALLMEYFRFTGPLIDSFYNADLFLKNNYDLNEGGRVFIKMHLEEIKEFEERKKKLRAEHGFK